MHYYLYISAIQHGQIRRETEKAETSTKKALPMESHQGITVNNPWTSPTPKEEAPQEATTKTASPLPVHNKNVS